MKQPLFGFLFDFLVYQRNKWKHQFSVAPLLQEDIERIWGYQILRACIIGRGKGEIAPHLGRGWGGGWDCFFQGTWEQLRVCHFLEMILEAVMTPALWWDTSSLIRLSGSALSRIQLSRQHQESSFGSIRALEEGVSGRCWLPMRLVTSCNR